LCLVDTQKEPLEITLEKYICVESRVPIMDLFNSAQAVLPNGDTYFFNDVGNVLLWLGRQKNPDEIVVWVYAQDTERYVLEKMHGTRVLKSLQWDMVLAPSNFVFMVQRITTLVKYNALHCVVKPFFTQWSMRF
jgi:hypothetical protein